ncbi:MAG: bifunctional RNase H/acid phosphatase [Nocardioides sp.]
MSVRSVLIQADGGSRGNPGPAAYGAVLSDAATGQVIAEDGTTIGVATNNVAEYSGLIAGLRLAAELAPEAEIEVRMDSKLVVEQMSGNWKIKHPDMKPLAMQAHQLAPFGTRYTWVPRAQNGHADRLANEALDGLRSGVRVLGETSAGASSVESEQSDQDRAGTDRPDTDWSDDDRADSRIEAARAAPTTLVLIRHGVTQHTVDRRFSGGLAGGNPGLLDLGRAQVLATARWLAPKAPQIEAVISSPVRRATESAEIVAEHWNVPVVPEPRFAELEFGTWDGLTFAEAAEGFPEEVKQWLGSLEVRAGGHTARGTGSGESVRGVQRRVRAGLKTVLSRHRGSTVAVLSHATPIKVLVADALGTPLQSVFRMELLPASVTVVTYYPPTDDRPVGSSLWLFNARPADDSLW